MGENYGAFQLSLALPPVAQYAKGHMLNVCADDIGTFRTRVAEALGTETAEIVLKLFATAAVFGVTEVQGESKVTPIERGEEIRSEKTTSGSEETFGICPECGEGTLVRKSGTSKAGKAYSFIGCNGFPDCKYIVKGEK